MQIPIIEDKPLARALYDAVHVDSVDTAGILSKPWRKSCI